jgi:hypothetical protein
MSQFRRVQELIPQLPPDHYAAGLKLSDPIVPALEYFLSLDEVPGFAKKLRDLRLKPVGRATTSARTLQWASLCAEIGGTALLGATMRLPILRFDEHSPRAQRTDSDCDLVVLLNGRETYVEIKRRAREDEQSVPNLFEERLVQLQSELPYGISVDFHPDPDVRQANWPDAASLLEAARQHVEAFEQQRARGEWFGEEVPPSIGAGPIILSFHLKAEVTLGGLAVGFAPDCVEDLKPYLLGPPGIGRNGEPMKPMVQEAIEKGADYLLCRVSPWDGWHEIIEGCFGRVDWTRPRACFAPKSCFRDLRGVVLFSRYDDCCVVNNPATEDGSWLLGQPSLESARRS